MVDNVGEGVVDGILDGIEFAEAPLAVNTVVMEACIGLRNHFQSYLPLVHMYLHNKYSIIYIYKNKKKCIQK